MALVRISELPTSTIVNPNVDMIPIIHSGVTQKISARALVDTGLNYEVVSASWVIVPTLYRISITGSGSVSIATKDVNGVIVENAIVYVVSSVTNEIHSFISEDTQYIKMTFGVGLTVFLLG